MNPREWLRARRIGARQRSGLVRHFSRDTVVRPRYRRSMNAADAPSEHEPLTGVPARAATAPHVRPQTILIEHVVPIPARDPQLCVAMTEVSQVLDEWMRPRRTDRTRLLPATGSELSRV